MKWVTKIFSSVVVILWIILANTGRIVVREVQRYYCAICLVCKLLFFSSGLYYAPAHSHLFTFRPPQCLAAGDCHCQ